MSSGIRILREQEKANAILREAKEVADETIKNFRKFGRENISAAEMEKERDRLRRKINDTAAASSLKAQKPKKKYKPSDFKLGESVKVLSMNLTGTITSRPDSKGNVTVQMGILRSQVNISDLEIIEEPSPYAPKKLKPSSKGRIGRASPSRSAPRSICSGRPWTRLLRSWTNTWTTRCSLTSILSGSFTEREPERSEKGTTNICAARNMLSLTISQSSERATQESRS